MARGLSFRSLVLVYHGWGIAFILKPGRSDGKWKAFDLGVEGSGEAGPIYGRVGGCSAGWGGGVGWWRMLPPQVFQSALMGVGWGELCFLPQERAEQQGAAPGATGAGWVEERQSQVQRSRCPGCCEALELPLRSRWGGGTSPEGSAERREEASVLSLRNPQKTTGRPFSFKGKEERVEAAAVCAGSGKPGCGRTMPITETCPLDWAGEQGGGTGDVGVKEWGGEGQHLEGAQGQAACAQEKEHAVCVRGQWPVVSEGSVASAAWKADQGAKKQEEVRSEPGKERWALEAVKVARMIGFPGKEGGTGHPESTGG